MKERIKITKGRISEFSDRGISVSPATLSTSISEWRRFGPDVVYVRLLHLDPQRKQKFLFLLLSQSSVKFFQFSEKILSS
jgi:hypothetical protein